jgi:diaminopimelate decarboxylase
MSAPIPRHLLPDNAGIDHDDHLLLAGLRAEDLVEEFGSPLFVYDEAQLRARCAEAVATFGEGVAYATKAFLCTEMARLAHEEGMFLDVATGGEMYVARHAGVPADRLVLHGNNKSDLEISMALEMGIGRIVVDSFDELDRLEVATAGLASPQPVLLRITPGIAAHTHEFIATGQDDSKFGFTVSTGAASEAVRRTQSIEGIELVGIHAHIGSQVFAAESFERAVGVLAKFVNPLALGELSVGGGLGVAYVAGEEAPTISQWGQVVAAACATHGVTARVLAEPGRSIAAAAAVTLYRVGTVKELPGIRTYVAVDGGMSDNPRPVLYGSGYETFLARAVSAPRPAEVRVVGKHCESGDVLIREASVPEDIVVGDVLCTPVTGAYGHSMGSNYNKVLRPAVVFVRDGAARVVVRRETYEDLVRLDC